MDFNLLVVLFAIAVTIHNIEEAVWLPRWSESAGRWHHPVNAREFRFAVVVLTVLAYVVSFLAVLGGRGSIGAYLVAGYALAMLLNVAFPHIAATMALRSYAPGTATALLLNLPVTICLLRRAILEHYIAWSRFVWIGPLVVVVMLALIPFLFALGRRQWCMRPSDQA